MESGWLVSSSFNPAPYYYEALALAGKGDLDSAQQVLQDAEHRLPEKGAAQVKENLEKMTAAA
jgi:cellobiose-specific phosphotransferase system component IIA